MANLNANPATQASAKPNVIFILADDLGYGDFGIFNKGLTSTPTIDRLVGEGVCLTQHYAGSTLCAPSRAAFLTGRYPHRSGAVDTLEGRGLDRIALRERTIADCFKSQGYATGLVGKWHSGALDPRFHPNARGFDEFAGFRGGWQDYYQWRLDYNGSFRKGDGRYLTDVFTDEAVSFIQRHKTEPFFLHLAYNAPHGPYQCPEDDVKPFAETGKHTTAVSKLYGMIRVMDRGVERVLGELERQGLANNTMVIFTSDNGAQFGGVGENCTDRFNSGWRGCKSLMYDGGIRVPLIVRWPDGALGGGRAIDQMMHFTDWLPTLMAAVGCEMPHASRCDCEMDGVSGNKAGDCASTDTLCNPINGLQLDGSNILPILQGEAGKVNPRRFWQWNRYTPVGYSNAAMRDGDWKLVRPHIMETLGVSREDLDMDEGLKYHPERYTDIVRDPEPERTIPAPVVPELYNLAEDPSEATNLAAKYPEKAAKMLGELEAWFENVEADRRSIDQA